MACRQLSICGPAQVSDLDQMLRESGEDAEMRQLVQDDRQRALEQVCKRSIASTAVD